MAMVGRAVALSEHLNVLFLAPLGVMEPMGCVKMGLSANCRNHAAKLNPFSAFQIEEPKNSSPKGNPFDFTLKLNGVIANFMEMPEISKPKNTSNNK
jgi:hypothetical protein